jgi:hypothetical protein
VALALREAADPRRQALQRYQRAAEKLLEQHDRLTTQQIKAAFELLVEVRNALLRELVQARPSDLDTFRYHQLQALNAAIERHGLRLRQQFGRRMAQAMQESWHRGQEFSLRAAEAAGIHLVSARDISLAQLTVAQTLAASLVQQVSDDFIARARQIVTRGVAGELPVQVVEQRIADLLAVEPDRRQRRFGPIAFQAERIMRTELNGVFNLANEMRQRAIAADTPGLRKYWLATRDERTRPSHRQAGARYQPGGSPGPIPFDQAYTVGGEAARFPHDPRLSARERVNCRCVSLLYSSDWFLPPERLSGAQARQRLLEIAQQEEQRLAELKQRLDEINEQMDRFWKERHDLSQEEFDRRERELIDEYAQLSGDYWERRTSLTQRVLARVLYADRPAHFEVRGGPTEPALRKRWEEGMEAFAWLVGPGRLDGKQIIFQMARQGVDRAYYLDDVIYLAPLSGTQTVVHELGHWLQQRGPGIHERVMAFYRRRTAGENPESLAALTGAAYRPEEVTRKDRFINPYMGKDYDAEFGAGAMDQIRNSEVLSMGIQLLFEDPARLAREDPEMFDFLWELLRGEG